MYVTHIIRKHWCYIPLRPPNISLSFNFFIVLLVVKYIFPLRFLLIIFSLLSSNLFDHNYLFSPLSAPFSFYLRLLLGLLLSSFFIYFNLFAIPHPTFSILYCAISFFFSSFLIFYLPSPSLPPAYFSSYLLSSY